VTTSNNNETSNGQRALWIFLGYTLVGPFFAAFAVVILLVLAPMLKFDALLPSIVASVGEIGMRTFVWSAIPAALTALAMVPVVLRHGTFPAVAVAMAAVVAFTVAWFLFPIDVPQGMLTALALLAGFVAIAVRYAMDLGGLLREQ
jgi:hypothetical protein